MVWIKKNALDSSKANGKDYDWCNFFSAGLVEFVAAKE